jgi:predicted O-linked N-acetylglucosamine transferase (SPINDLY family)
MTGSKEDVYKCRLDFLRELKNLSNWLITNKCTSAHLAVGSHTPFYLAYHEENNRELLARYGELCVRIMKHGSDIQQYVVRKEKNRSIIKIGIVSAHIYDHSVWNALVKSWVKYLDKKRFEIHLFYLGSKNDHETEWARQKSESFQQDYTNVDQWVSAITEKKCDVLIYPEIGMNAMTIKLASLRLAGVQMTSWGHPETTGLPTMDYYLSAKCLEPRDAQDNYTETLVTLPNLGCCYRPIQIEVTVPDFRMLGIEPDRPILVCAGAPFKYNPQHDAVFTGIARQIEKCTFIFFEYRIPELSSILFRRLKHVFLSENLDINRYVKFVPWQERSAFYGLMEKSCVYLDTIGFSGFNTAMQAIECSLPVVSREGSYLRGRLASGILRKMGMDELIANSDEEYVLLVCELVNNPEYRREIQKKITSNRKKIFNDQLPVHSLEKFIEKTVNSICK